MMKQVEDISSEKTEHKKPVFGDFQVWFLDLLKTVDPSIVIAIARGAVRFLQLSIDHSQLGTFRYISHHAIPFLEDHELNGARVLLFDDSVIFGSTMHSVIEELEKRRAVPICAAYVVDRRNFYGEKRDNEKIHAKPSHYFRTPLTIKHKKWPYEIRQHHARLVNSILRTSLHYNLDFPTFEVDLENSCKLSAYDVAEVFKETELFHRYEDVSSQLSVECDIARYSGLLKKQMWNSLEAEGIRYRPYGKVRVIHSVKEGKILITPIMQLEMSDLARFNNIKFSDNRLQELWGNLYSPKEDLGRLSATSLFRLVTAFVGLAAGVPLCKTINSTFEKYAVVHGPKLLLDDIKIILGEKNATALEQTWNALSKIELSEYYNEKSNHKSKSVHRENTELQKKLKKLFLSNPRIVPETGEFLYESVGKLFIGMRLVTDSTECRVKNPKVDRLITGLTFQDIRRLISDSTGTSYDNDDISLCIDSFVDNGLAVPKIVNINGVYLRAFYCGEDLNNQPPPMFKAASHAAYTSFLRQKKAKYLTDFDFHKLCVALKSVMSWIPISPGLNTFGYTSTIADQELIQFLTKGNYAPFTKAREENRNVLIPNEEYVPLVDPTWETPEQKRDFFDGFNYTAMAFSKISNAAKLLLTTCRTHRHTFNAIAYEAHSWASYGERSFCSVLESLRNVAFCKLDEVNIDRNSMYWSIQYISEARKKYHIFHNDYDKNIRELEKSFCSQKPGGKRWWDYLCERNMSNRDKEREIEYRFEQLLPLLRQMSDLTVFLVGILDASGILTKDELEKEFAANSVSLEFKEFEWLRKKHYTQAARDYNTAIEKGQVPARSILKTKLSGLRHEISKTISTQSVIDQIATVTKCFKEIGFAVEQLCPKYEGDNLEFPFSPDRNRKRLRDGSVEVHRDNCYVLAMDIIEGTNSEQTNKMKETISEVLRSFRTKGLIFEETGDDKSVAISMDPLVLYDVAKTIRIRGEDLKVKDEPFGGTRKGMYYGPVVTVERPNGTVLLHDRTRTNVIPAVTSMFNAIDKRFAKSECNAWLAISKKAMEKCAGVFGLCIDDYEMVPVKEKHFPGHCYFMDLK